MLFRLRGSRMSEVNSPRGDKMNERKRLIVLARNHDEYKHWCRMMGLSFPRDAIYLHDIHQLCGQRGNPWLRLCPVERLSFLRTCSGYDEWMGLTRIQEFRYVEPCNWHCFSAHFTRVQELEEELDRVRTKQLAVIANCRIW